MKKIDNKKNLTLTIGWLYPDLMSTYGDRGNIICLRKRCEWRGIKVIVQPITQDTAIEDIKKIDLLFGGGSQDIQQEIVMRDLKDKKGKIIKEMIENDLPALFVCGSPQLMGKYYEPAFGTRINGLGIFDMISVNPGKDKPRCIGNIIASVNWENCNNPPNIKTVIVGFENHGGRTYLGKSVKPFAKVLHGFGNNGEDGTEGVVYKNAVGCYFHGPFLPKNPQIADYFIKQALFKKYQANIQLSQLDEMLEVKARETVMDRYNFKT